MNIQVQPYQAQHIPLVKQFNKRLENGNASARFSESNIPSWLPKSESSRLYQEYFLAIDNGAVRGAYILKYQDFLINGQIISIAAYQLPISEGIINPDFVNIGMLLTLDALKKLPELFVLGMGGYSEQLPQLLEAMRWSICEIPFYFKVICPFNFLRRISFLRKSLLRRILLDSLAYTGTGWLAIHASRALRSRKIRSGSLSVIQIEEFDEKAEFLWNEVKNNYKMIAVRDQETLKILYPQSSSRFIRIGIFENQQYIGWAVLLDTPMSNHKQFGSMRVGSVVDCLAHPTNAGKILSCATDYLVERKVDIIVANHSHVMWKDVFNNIGYIKGPSNFLFGASRNLAKHVRPFEANEKQIYFMRGDGDGPINL
jgi:hypothetical protein